MASFANYTLTNANTGNLMSSTGGTTYTGSTGNCAGSAWTNMDGYPTDYQFRGVKYEGKSKDIKKFVEELRNKELFCGGNDKAWLKVKSIAKKWLNRAISDKLITGEYKIKRANEKFINSARSMYKIVGAVVTRNSKFIEYNHPYYKPNAHEMATISLRESIYEKIKNKESYATLECEVLSLGGCILGVSDNSLYVHFPLLTETVANKLFEEEKKRDYPASVFNTLVGASGTGIYSSFSNMANTVVTGSGTASP